jgi:predicted DNA-binding protein
MTTSCKQVVREGDQYLLRLPPGFRERLRQRAAENSRSVKAEIVKAIESYLDADDLVKRVERIEKHLGIRRD